MLPRELRTAKNGNELHIHAEAAIKQIRHDCETSYEFHQWINPDFKPVKDWKEEKQWEQVQALLPLASCLLPLASCLLPLASCLLMLGDQYNSIVSRQAKFHALKTCESLSSSSFDEREAT